MPRASGFQTRSVASSGPTYAVPPGPSVLSSIVGGVKDISGIFDKIGDGKERQAKVGYYDAQGRSADAEAREHDAKAAADAAKIARQAAMDRDAEDATRERDAAIASGGDAVAAQRRFQERLAPRYFDQYGADGARALMADGLAIDSAIPNAPGADGKPATPGTSFSRNAMAAIGFNNGHALQGPDGSTSLSADENVDRTGREYKRKRDDDIRTSGDRRFAATTSAGATVASANIGAGASERNNQRTVAEQADKTYREDKWNREKFNLGGDAGGKTVTTDEVGEDGKKYHKVEQTVVAPRVPRVPNPKPQPAAAGPTEAEFMAAAKKANPGASDADLKAYYANKYRKGR